MQTPTLMDPAEAARVLRESLKHPEKPITVADASTESGLALRDAERGLHFLTSEFRGHLRVTNDGDLLYLFPTGFSKPWETRDAISRGLAKAGKFALGVGRFVVRAWLTVVLFTYVAAFVAILIGLTFAQSNNNSRRNDFGGAGLAYGLMRIMGDALFWTFHPFSPFVIGRQNDRGQFGRRSEPADQTPFYEKVNRFFFGPTPPPEDPRAMERKILALIRAEKGRVGLADVMRVTGLPRDQADPLMARLMLDYEGNVEVSEAGGITYKFEAIRKTASPNEKSKVPAPAWQETKHVPPLTGNTAGFNFLVVALNSFNLAMGAWALSIGLTLSRLPELFGREPMELFPTDGTAVVLGLIPLLFSLALFMVPVARAVVRPFKKKKITEENGRLAVLREVLTRTERKQPLTDRALTEAWRTATGREPDGKQIARSIAELGGDVDLENKEGGVRYRVADLETEAEALEQERDAASDDEAKVSKVIFASDR